VRWLCSWVAVAFGRIWRRHCVEEGDGLSVGVGLFCGGLNLRPSAVLALFVGGGGLLWWLYS
jgi:hypothetical protein